jgi:spore maturation protein CgeB
MLPQARAFDDRSPTEMCATAAGGRIAFAPDDVQLVVFGLTITSSWGNGHATLWRALVRALGRRGHRVTFFERDVPYYRGHRDLTTLDGHGIVLYEDWRSIARAARHAVAGADAAIVTSYCPDASAAAALVREADRAVPCFYDLDTPVTLSRLENGEHVEYFPPDGFAGFDLVLSYTGGAALDRLRELGASLVVPLYGSVDPDVHHPASPRPAFAADLSYLGTYAADRQEALTALLLAPANRRPDLRFLIGGSMYPPSFTWAPNLFYVRHVPPPDHPAFFSSSRFTLNVTRAAMAAMGDCPSGRLFEAAACGTPIVSDWWDGLDRFFTPGDEIIVARDADDVLAALDMEDSARGRLAERARDRALTDHTADRRASTLEEAIARARGRAAPRAATVRDASAHGVTAEAAPGPAD